MPISPNRIPPRLRAILADAGVEVTCRNLRLLIDQTEDGTATDARLAEAAANMTGLHPVSFRVSTSGRRSRLRCLQTDRCVLLEFHALPVLPARIRWGGHTNFCQQR